MARKGTDARYWREKRKNGEKKSRPKPVEFVAIDGEGIEEGDSQSYALLSSSLHRPIINRKGLSTEDCLRFILSQKVSERTQVVAFSFSYDINMLLRDVPWTEILHLYQDDECWYHGKLADYHIRCIGGKSTTITEYSQRRYFTDETSRIRSVTVWDSFGFFQSSFLSAVSEWRLELCEEQQALLESGKAERGGFLWSNIERIASYNHLECDLLVQLMNKVQEMLRGLDLFLSRWDGAGAIAAALMKKHGLKAHVNRGFHPDVEDAIMRAYFGGRSQCVQFGIFEGPIYHYDINSSYPSSYLDLPSLHGHWEETDKFISEQPYVLYQLEWDVPPKDPLTPFPYRDKGGSIRYPHQGRGVYHSQLVTVAMERWKKNINIERGWVFVPDDDTKPFAFILPFMKERLRLKRERDLRHITMKLGANSIYGKTAQSISFGDSLPPYQSYFWAGLITSWTHKQLLTAAIQAPQSIIFFGTDSIFSQTALALPLGIELGTWEDCGILTQFELYQPGLYRMTFEEDGEEIQQVKTRGFHSDEIHFDCIRKVWERDKYTGVYGTPVSRFQGYQLCAAQSHPEEWGQWKKFKKRINLCPGGFGTVLDKERRYFVDSPGKANTFRFQYIDGGKTLSHPFTKTDIRLPTPDREAAMVRFREAMEWQDNPTLE